MKIAVLAAAAAFTFAGAASAATVNTLTDTDTTGFVGTDFSSMAVPGLTTLPPLELDLFDGSLGNLTGVKITIEAEFVAEGTLTNNGTTGLFSFTQAVAVEAIPNVAGASSLSIGLSETDGPTVFSPAETKTVMLADDDMVMDTPAVAGFIGAAGDVFTIDFATLSSSTVAGGGNLQALIETDASITATVEYTYLTQIPLPASAPLLLAALGGLGFLSRKRKAA